MINKAIEHQKRLAENPPQESQNADDEEEEEDDNDQPEDDHEDRPDTHSDESEDEEEDEIKELPEAYIKQPKFRKSVSAEAFGMYNKKGYFSARVVTKEDQTKAKIKDRLLRSFLFQSLDEHDLNIVIDAMEEKIFTRNQHVIEQNDDGDELFVVGEGKLHCYRSEKGDTNLVKTYSPGDYFGELALLYNAPRAATIIAIKDNTVCYSLDRLTFNHIVKDAAIKRREKYEEILKRVKVLDSMDNTERNKLIDSISEVKFKKGECIIKQGEPGNKFYFILEGTCLAKKHIKEENKQIDVMEYKVGDYFGEVSLLRNQPRAASVYATSDVITLFLDRQMFSRLLGPLEDILKRNMELYTHFDMKDDDLVST